MRNSAPGLATSRMSLQKSSKRGDGALGVHDAAGAEGVADALVDAIFQGDVDVGLEGLEAALADHADDVIGPGESRAAVGG